MIPDFDERGLLPPGIHEATWAEVLQRFGHTERRRSMLRRMEVAVRLLADAGCQRVHLDGSFVCDVLEPNDYDACWDPAGMNVDALSELFFDFSNDRATMNTVFGGELFSCTWETNSEGETYLDFFQRGRDGTPKGIIVLDPRTL